MGYYNGTSLLPVNFSFHREIGKNEKKKFGLKPSEYKAQFNKKRTSKSHGANRKKELDIKKTDSTVRMIQYAIKNKLKAQYVLTDSWFTCWKVVKAVLDMARTMVNVTGDLVLCRIVSPKGVGGQEKPEPENDPVPAEVVSVEA